MHLNPVKRKLVAHPGDWPWSSFSFYASKDTGLVRIDAVRRSKTRQSPQAKAFQNRTPGHPKLHAKARAPAWGLNFGTGGLADDALGNLLSMAVFKCSGPSLSLSVNSKNQISSSGFSYDADGDMTNDANYTYAFNGASEITSPSRRVNYT